MIYYLFKSMTIIYHTPGDVVIKAGNSVIDNVTDSILHEEQVFFCLEGKYLRNSRLQNVSGMYSVDEEIKALYKKARKANKHDQAIEVGQIFGEISAIYGSRRT